MQIYAEKAVSGGAWTAIQIFIQRFLGFVVQIILARLLLPEEFSLVALSSVFLIIGNMISQGGLGGAIIQAKDLCEKDIRTVFTINILVGLLCMLSLFAIASDVAIFYRQPELESVLKILSLSVFLTQIGAVHGALFGRTMNYKKVTIASLPALFLSSAVAVIMAWRGWGVWALVVQNLIMSSVNSITLISYSEWRPRIGFSFSSAKKLLPFGSNLMFTRVLNVIFENIYIFVIGRIYSPAEVAFYSRAKSFQVLATGNAMQIMNKVTFPLLSRMQGTGLEKHIYKKLLFLISWVLLPLLGLIGGISEPLIFVLLTEKWMTVVPFLRILCISGGLLLLNAVCTNFISASGESGLLLKLSVLNKVMIVLNIAMTYRFGIITMLTGHSVVMLFTYCVTLGVLQKKYALSAFRQFVEIFPALLGALSVFCMSFFLGSIFDDYYLAFGIGTLGGCCVWWLLLRLNRSGLKLYVDLLGNKFALFRTCAKSVGLYLGHK